jgi:hypothetical protein
MTDTSAGTPVNGTRRTVSGLERQSLKPAAIVLAIILVFTVGWSILDAVIPTPGEQVEPGSVVTLAQRARFTPASDWKVEDTSNARAGRYVISNSGVLLVVNTGATRASDQDILASLQDDLKKTLPAAVFSSASTFRASRGLTGVQSNFQTVNVSGYLVAFSVGGTGVNAYAYGPVAAMPSFTSSINEMFVSIEIIR